MDRIPFVTQKNERVEIKPDVTDVYLFARAYMQGWVRDQRRDRLGYPEIYIEWDKNHWAYSGELDGWTLESHFKKIRPKESPVPEKPEKSVNVDKLEEALANAFTQIMGSIKGEEPTEVEPDTKYDMEEPVEVPSYDGHLGEAFEAAQNGVAFYLFVINEHNGALVPDVYAYGREGHEEAMPLLGATMSDQASQLHIKMALEEIEEIRRARKENGRG